MVDIVGKVEEDEVQEVSVELAVDTVAGGEDKISFGIEYIVEVGQMGVISASREISFVFGVMSSAVEKVCLEVEVICEAIKVFVEINDRDVVAGKSEALLHWLTLEEHRTLVRVVAAGMQSVLEVMLLLL